MDVALLEMPIRYSTGDPEYTHKHTRVHILARSLGEGERARDKCSEIINVQMVFRSMGPGEIP